jgi:hypothetical protein
MTREDTVFVEFWRGVVLKHRTMTRSKDTPYYEVQVRSVVLKHRTMTQGADKKNVHRKLNEKVWF